MAANKRGVYDIHGNETLRNGIVDKNGAIKGAYKYGGNAYEIFEKFFGTTNPFALIKDGKLEISNFFIFLKIKIQKNYSTCKA